MTRALGASYVLLRGRARGRNGDTMSKGGSARFDKMSVIIPAAFINSLAVGTMSLGMLFVVKDLYGAGPGLVGSLGALWSVSYLTGCLAMRRVAGRLAPRISLLVALTSSAAILTAFLWRPGLAQAFASFTAYGFMMSFFWPPLMGWLAKGHEGADLNRATSAFNFSWSIGGIVSAYMAGILSERDKLLPIWVSVALFAVNAVFVASSRAFYKDEGAPGSGSVAAADETDRSTPLRFPAWLGAFLIYAVMGVILNVFPVFARDELALSESSIGLALTVRAAATTVGFLVLGKVTSWQFKRAALPALSVLVAAALVAIAFQRGIAGFSVGFAVVGLLQAMVYNNSLFYATSGAPDRDRRASVHEILLTSGQVVGSVSGGFLYQAVSMPAVYAGLSLLLGVGAAAQAAMIYKPRISSRS